MHDGVSALCRGLVDDVAANPRAELMSPVRYLLRRQAGNGLQQAALTLPRSAYDRNVQRVALKAAAKPV